MEKSYTKGREYRKKAKFYKKVMYGSLATLVLSASIAAGSLFVGYNAQEAYTKYQKKSELLLRTEQSYIEGDIETLSAEPAVELEGILVKMRKEVSDLKNDYRGKKKTLDSVVYPSSVLALISAIACIVSSLKHNKYSNKITKEKIIKQAYVPS